ncbi:hypothetical protein TKV_c20950 [Thermoanaerobacter kivui]|uniref:Uncharacterized protein n=1 Tax=Thermoanaerobacter kivui TaxID=2325 RepID=A0A097ATT5_THEKI|nr:hypothetical protein [Thermoanaerobacter kivui]AIS53228.1 hypothetical protein TKV_c20950 [Thermoanaerobacter kivui]
MYKSPRFFKGKLYKSVRGNFFEEEAYEEHDNKNLKEKSSFSSLLNQGDQQDLQEIEAEEYENE